MELTYLTPEALNHFIKEAFNEDIGDGDHSTLAAINAEAKSEARLLIKGNGILAGVDMAKAIFNYLDDSLEIDFLKGDGDLVRAGDVGMTVNGSTRSILSAERLVLNCMQRMSGIATFTHELARMIAPYKAKLLDTRKTTPNFRIAEKWAVYIGGGANHRFGLYDMVMLKDNHIDFAGGIAYAVEAVKHYLGKIGKPLKIEVETRSLEEVKEALNVGGVDVIMLDNMSPDLMRQAVDMVDGTCVLEASGGITKETIIEVAKSGVDFISVGALTHSAKSMDISLKAV